MITRVSTMASSSGSSDGGQGTGGGHVGGVATAGWIFLALALLAASAGFGQVPERTFTLAPLDTLVLDITGLAAGTTWIGPDTLAVLDDVPDTLAQGGRREVRLVFQDRSGTILLVKDFTGVLDRALAYDEEFLWGCGDDDQGGSILYKISLDSLLVKDAYDLPGHRPTGMCFDGRYLWITDRDSGRLDRFDPKLEAVSRSVFGPAFSPCGVAHDGRHTWLTDVGTGRMYRLTGGRENWTGTVTAESFLHLEGPVLLIHDGFYLYYVPYGEHFAVRVVFP